MALSIQGRGHNRQLGGGALRSKGRPGTECYTDGDCHIGSYSVANVTHPTDCLDASAGRVLSDKLAACWISTVRTYANTADVAGPLQQPGRSNGCHATAVPERRIARLWGGFSLRLGPGVRPLPAHAMHLLRRRP